MPEELGTLVFEQQPEQFHSLMIIGVEGSDLVARSPVSRIELGRHPVRHEGVLAHTNAGYALIQKAFDSLAVEGFHRASKKE